MLVGKEREVVGKLLFGGKVAEKLIGLHHILIYGVEIVEQRLAPEVKLIESLISLLHIGKSTVQLDDKPVAIGNSQRRMSMNKLVDANIPRLPRWLLYQLG